MGKRITSHRIASHRQYDESTTVTVTVRPSIHICCVALWCVGHAGGVAAHHHGESEEPAKSHAEIVHGKRASAAAAATPHVLAYIPAMCDVDSRV